MATANKSVLNAAELDLEAWLVVTFSLPCYPECNLMTNSIGITWELQRMLITPSTLLS